MNKMLATLVLVSMVLVGGCANLDPVQQEKIKVYEEHKKREAASYSQKETDAAVRRLEKAIKD